VEPISASICQVSVGFPALSDESSKAAAKVKIYFSIPMLFIKKINIRYSYLQQALNSLFDIGYYLMFFDVYF